MIKQSVSSSFFNVFTVSFPPADAMLLRRGLISMLLEMKGITKQYGSVLANDSINLTLEKGEILAVVGENGAGKSTLMKILYGLEQPTCGEVYLNGNQQSFRSPHDAIRAGIGMVQQHFMLFSEFTVAENIVYGNEPKKNSLFFNRSAADKLVQELSKKYLLDVDPRAKIKNCPVGLQQRVEILKILYQNADIIILDEPSAVLTPQEVSDLLKTMKKLASMGKSIIIITHKLHEVMDASDRVMVMRSGKFVKETKTSETSIEELSFLMVGRRIIDKEVPEQPTTGNVLTVTDLRLTDKQGKKCLDGLSMHVDAGEIVGIAGVSGNGQSELIECITGLNKADAGEITLLEKDIVKSSVSKIRDLGCACIPEDRYKYGCAKDANMTETALIAHQYKPRFSKHGILKNNIIRNYVTELLQRYDVKYSGLFQKAGELSGGNIQKLIVAREIEQNTPLLIAAEPTRGVDIGAMEFIHGKLLEKRANGGAILLVSSELSEIMELCDRIYTIFDGKINGEFTKAEATEEKLGLLMMGGKQDA